MKSRKRGKPERTGGKLPLQSIALGCTVLAAVLAGAWVLFPQEAGDAVKLLAKTVGIQLPEEPKKPEQQEAKIARPPAEQRTQTEPLSASVNLPSAEPEQPVLVPAAGQPAPPPMSCSQAAGKLRGFLDDLEKKSYLKEFNLRQPLRKHLDSMKDKLAAKSPTVVRETDDLYTVISNTAHFFRVIGKDNIQLLKTLLEQEQGKLEDMAAALHAASIGPDCPADTVQLPFSMAYEYSVFFLNTIGGRSYLFRREARTRLLTNYYALLLIDEANVRSLNSHGINISGMIQPLIREMEATNQLARKEEYLARLRELAERHPVRSS
ncbi:MAG: hypothetical protein ACTFAL_06255 [Candidatus Electronema sp. V4]|uniref:hypothetical protein n=1 Tax=Candidatus Electronema sp. V4 TaxID=3454756 RepID=UPI004055875A